MPGDTYPGHAVADTLLLLNPKNTVSPNPKVGAHGDSFSLRKGPLGGVSRRHPGTRGSLYLSQRYALKGMRLSNA